MNYWHYCHYLDNIIASVVNFKIVEKIKHLRKKGTNISLILTSELRFIYKNTWVTEF